MKRACSFLVVLALLGGVLGFLGPLHPVFDAIAIGRWVAVYGGLFFLGMCMVLQRKFVISGLAFVVLISVFAAKQASDQQPGDVRVYSKNLLYFNRDITAIAADILQAKPDVVVLQEVSWRNRHVLSELKQILPHQVFCGWEGWNGVAILSRWPLADADQRCSDERSLMAVKLDRPGGAFWMVGVHLQHPWPDVQWRLLDRSLIAIRGLDDGVIVAGDFNSVPWSGAAKRVGRLTRTQPIHIPEATFHLWGVGLPLDQVWAAGGRAEVRPLLGSDHHGIVADVWPSKLDLSSD